MTITGIALATLLGFSNGGLPAAPPPMMVVRISQKLPLPATEILQMFRGKPGLALTVKRGEQLALMDLLLIFEAPHFDPVAHLDEIGVEWAVIDDSARGVIESRRDWKAVFKADVTGKNGMVDLLAKLSIGSQTREIGLKIQITD